MYFATVINICKKLSLYTWNTKYSQDVACTYKTALSVDHILLESPFTAELFQKNRYDFSACKNVSDISYNADVITCIVN